MKTVLMIGVLSRAFVFAVAVVTNILFGLNPSCPKLGCWNVGIPFFSLFSRWDSGYYADIAVFGYTHVVTVRWEFFPFYPILMAVLGHIITITHLLPLNLAVHVAGFVISNLSFLGCIYYLYKLTEQIFGRLQFAYYSASLLALYPAGVFFSAVYSESLFLLLLLSSLYYWRLGRFWSSASLGFLTSLTRPIGVFLVIPYLYELFTRSSRRKAIMFIPVVSITLGYLSFMAYSQLMTGTPFATFVAERTFFGVNYIPYDLLVLAIKEIYDHPITIPFLALGVGGVVTAIMTARREPEQAITLHATCLLFIYVYTPPIISFARYSVTLVPMYWILSRCAKKPLLWKLIWVAFLVLLAIGTGLFVNWYPFY